MKLRVLACLTAGLIAAFALAAPGRAADDVTQTRAVPHFDRIRLQGAFDVEITAGAPRASVVVTAAADAVDRVTTEVRDGELLIGMKSGTNWLHRTPELKIDVSALRGFANEGAGKVRITGVAGGDLAISNAGAASITASGRADDVTISLNGTGRIDTTDLSARDVSVDNNGVGSVRVRASGKLTMAVNGVGEIRYAGKPAKVESQVNGVGRISPL